MLTLLFSLRDCFRARAFLQAEILALRHQLLVLQRSSRGHKLRLNWADRVLWVWLSQLWNDWRSALLFAFCHGDRGAVRASRMPIHLVWVIKMPSRIKIKRLERYHSICCLRGALQLRSNHGYCGSRKCHHSPVRSLMTGEVRENSACNIVTRVLQKLRWAIPSFR
jgi:hypothetical protein